jgi:hypothetical protein
MIYSQQGRGNKFSALQPLSGLDRYQRKWLFVEYIDCNSQ